MGYSLFFELMDRKKRRNDRLRSDLDRNGLNP